jgi:hypothetical protein
VGGGDGTPTEDEQIATFRETLEKFQKRLPALESASPRDEERIEELKGSIQSQEAAIAALEKTKTDRERKALLTMKNMSSILYALDAKGNLSKNYMDGAAVAHIATAAQNTNIHEIPNYASTLEDYITTFLDDVAAGRVKALGSVDETGSLNNLLRENALNTKQLARMMTLTLMNAGSATFLESTVVGQRTFSQTYPKLTGVFRLGMIAAYVFTVLKVLQVLQQGTGSASTFEKVTTYGSFSFLLLETLTSLVPNIKGLISGIFSAAPPVPAPVGGFLQSVSAAISNAATRIVGGIRAVGTSLSNAIANSPLFAAIRGFFSRVMGAIGRAASWVGGRIVGGVTGLITRIGQSAAFQALRTFVGKAFSVVMKGLMIVGSLWTTVMDGINMVNVWNTSKSDWQKALVTIEFTVLCIATICTVIGVFSSAAIWSGAGAILALVALGIGLLVSYLWPPESTLQKIVSEVLIPFIDRTTAPAVAAVKAAVQPVKLEAAEIAMAEGQGSEFALA